MSTPNSMSEGDVSVFGEAESLELQRLEELYHTTPEEITDTEMARLLELRELQINASEPHDAADREETHLMGLAAVDELTAEESGRFRDLIGDGDDSRETD